MTFTFLPHLVLYVKYMQTFCKTWLGISLKFTWKRWWVIGRKCCLSTSFVSFSANCPGPESIALIVPTKSGDLSKVSSYGKPEVRAWSLETMNSCPSELISLTYLMRVSNELCKILHIEAENELNEWELHCIRAFTASKGSCFPTYIHCRVAGHNCFCFCKSNLKIVIISVV